MLTRRDFMMELAAASAAIAAAPSAVWPAPPFARPAVVSIHMDQPYIDATGRALPYLPPPGARGGAALAHLTEAEFRSRFMYQ